MLCKRLLRMTLPVTWALLALSCSPGEPTAPSDVASVSVVLTELDPNMKIIAIKEVRSVTHLGLAEAKGMVEDLPATIQSDLTLEQAEALVVRLRQAGLTSEIVAPTTP